MKNCFVLGCGRSGTSLLMSLFKNSGYFMGSKLYGPTNANPSGYYESKEINDINENLLKQILPYRFTKYDDVVLQLPIIRYLLPLISYNSHIPIKDQRWLARIKPNNTFRSDSSIDNKIQPLISNQPFCFKDPRFSFTLPYWQNHLISTETHYLVVYRHPVSTVNSILKEMGNAPYLKNKLHLTTENIFELWFLYYTNILNISMNDPNWTFMHYEQILDKSIVRQLSELTKAKIDTSSINPLLYRSKPQKEKTPIKHAKLYKYLCSKSAFNINR